ncbi:MAG: hypothetical protein K5849_06590 [Bacteroidales bacterium]|nr:hypothetical protein [Bacteroidales bacterium]
MKKLFYPLGAALLTLTACQSGNDSYHGFSFSCPDTYSIQQEDDEFGRIYLLESKRDELSFVYMYLMPDFIEENFPIPEDNHVISKEICEIMLEEADSFLSAEGVVVNEDLNETIQLAQKDDFSAYARTDFSGTHYDAPYRARLSADFWGDTLLILLMVSYSDEETETQIREIFQTFEWKE